MKIKENMRYSTYAEREEEDNEFIRDEDILMDCHRVISKVKVTTTMMTLRIG
jgi:hypothetical protein